ncbi:glucokinase [Carbonactinospora thermoautotrophica]|uniref:Glucokinase n=1 Tax=Carbonactinospora thermoautotrophica TaxID=1469144 RepID=A0A132MQX7_9ACTN|nr:ROK family glucokinase [Carbonactinospora thermoautotrophica]KWX00277.1 glucokinase [Carbonactinospora thermoautotrophica]KWX01662.1 Glucokinase [Carbonactinospora thermoautotrophica]KWX08925.1 glucokinase [Carbonactinospora thermoautotrophica]MCX9190826.1 glucokinase [Carbonactinospora thermoautotrophica]
MGLTIGVDIGGTKVAGGVVDEDGTIIAQARRDTPSTDSKAALDTIVEVVRELAAEHPVDAVGLGAAGFIDEKRSTVLFAPNLSWRNTPVKEYVQQHVEMPVYVENDANAAAWAEYRFGAGQGESHLLCITLGTGIGGGIVVGGHLYRGRYGIAAEFGHMRVVPEGMRCGCGNKGCWEMYASGHALVREARQLAASGSPMAERLLELSGGQPERITGPIVTQAAQEGDPVSIELFEELGHWLGQGLASLAAIIDPGCFVIGGGVSEAGDLLLKPAREAFHRALTGRGHRPEAEIRLAALGNQAGLVGAADLARHPHPH